MHYGNAIPGICVECTHRNSEKINTRVLVHHCNRFNKPCVTSLDICDYPRIMEKIVDKVSECDLHNEEFNNRFREISRHRFETSFHFTNALRIRSF